MLLSHEAVAHSTATATEPAQDPGIAPRPSIEIDSLPLLQGRRDLRIRHANEYYRLRPTRNDKLILTK